MTPKDQRLSVEEKTFTIWLEFSKDLLMLCNWHSERPTKIDPDHFIHGPIEIPVPEGK